TQRHDALAQVVRVRPKDRLRLGADELERAAADRGLGELRVVDALELLTAVILWQNPEAERGEPIQQALVIVDVEMKRVPRDERDVEKIAPESGSPGCVGLVHEQR